MTDVQTLIQTLASTDGTARRHAALALGATRDAAAAPALLDRLRIERDPRVREDLTWALVQHADEAEADLLAMLTSPEADQRRAGAHVLSKIGDPAHFESLRPLVGDEHADVAIKAYRAVANTGRHEAAGALAERLGDGDALQRDALTTAMHRLGEKAVPALTAALGDPDAEVRAHAAEALGHLGGPHADPAVDALEASADDGDTTVALHAVSALGQLSEVSDGALARIADGGDALLAQVAGRFLAARSESAKAKA
ncbi:HEAT repeat domain-containing protein [Tessaracoccus sp. MC1679]|uniref:HEAT repeat domain-containing protein n=1 Tax=unclassified Tessaracoccus TaxID=2635419 RepID=UPI001603C80B|nr:MULTISPECIES: HEAT repeat domain-containing protein [unclassified Tessaracoccus]MBB1512197.1 HEAT repeat domain-containing protein [Tessaracoccus sp. MC1627]MBB1515154.1 HEAT repeat domain-containing protein [Tessaracoccus sp. MC1679]